MRGSTRRRRRWRGWQLPNWCRDRQRESRWEKAESADSMGCWSACRRSFVAQPASIHRVGSSLGQATTIRWMGQQLHSAASARQCDSGSARWRPMSRAIVKTPNWKEAYQMGRVDLKIWWTYSLSPIASHSSIIDMSSINLLECCRLLSSSSGQTCIHHSVGFSTLAAATSAAASASWSDGTAKKFI